MNNEGYNQPSDVNHLGFRKIPLAWRGHGLEFRGVRKKSIRTLWGSDTVSRVLLLPSEATSRLPINHYRPSVNYLHTESADPVSWGLQNGTKNAVAGHPLGLSLGGVLVWWDSTSESLHPLHNSFRASTGPLEMLHAQGQVENGPAPQRQGQASLSSGFWEPPSQKWGARTYQCPVLPGEEEEPAWAHWAKRQHHAVSRARPPEGQVSAQRDQVWGRGWSLLQFCSWTTSDWVLQSLRVKDRFDIHSLYYI